MKVLPQSERVDPVRDDSEMLERPFQRLTRAELALTEVSA
jgi:hypothetical protein